MGILAALAELGVERWSGSLTEDHRNDPVYKAKLQEHIERNQKFEEERNQASNSGSTSNE